MKRGRFSRYEMQFVKDNAESMDYLEIAESLDRHPEKIREYIEKAGFEINLKKGNKKASPNLKNRSFWPLIRQQFSAVERQYIEEEWDKIFQQFQENVTPTEEMQIIDMIKIDVMMHRLLIKKENSRKTIEELRSKLSELTQADDPGRLKERQEIKNEIAILINGEQNSIREYKDLQTEKNKILKDMKATRDQRYARVEATSESMKAWMADLITNHAKRERLGKHLEKIRVAAIDEEIRLAAWHRYEDGVVDQPLLSPSTVKDGHQTT